MNRRSFLTATAALAAAAPTPAFAAGLDWPQADLRAQGFDPARLESMRAALEKRNTHGLLILHRGRKVLEWYSADFDAQKKHYTASMAKALVGGTSLLFAVSDGHIRPNDKAARFIPSWAGNPRKSQITIRQLATHTSGIEDSSVDGYEHGKEPAWKGAFWRRDPDPFTTSLNDAPVIFQPGTGYEYSNPGMAILAYCVTASLKGAPQPDIFTLLRDRVMRPIGIPDDDWSIGYGKAYKVNGLDVWANWGGGAFTPRATARVGEWMMAQGKWAGQQLIKPSVISQATHYTGMTLPKRSAEIDAYNPGLGLCWYTNFNGVWPAVPRDAFAGSGAQQQTILVVPSLELVLVRNGGDLGGIEKGRSHWGQTYSAIFEPAMAAMGYPYRPTPPAYPKSAVIKSVTFAPASQITRKALDCDNWPVTWADDGALYTSYGDGRGFEPHVEKKLSMGFAKVEGPASNYTATNIRSAGGETLGDGKSGAKASGMLMVDGVLYMWVRNTGNCQLWWSADKARTWKQEWKLDRSFGSPAFLNFGRNYAGARDNYVYAYSQDGPSAYEIDNGVVLARAPRDRIRDRTAWEFFSGDAAKPAWSRDIANCRHALAYPGHVQRVDAVYHPATKRYLLAVSYGHDGGWGIFDAPNPWGPWSVAFHTDYWGLGQTHGYRLPSKWMAADGRTMALIFSGLQYDGVLYDAFCVREMKLDF